MWTRLTGLLNPLKAAHPGVKFIVCTQPRDATAAANTILNSFNALIRSNAGALGYTVFDLENAHPDFSTMTGNSASTLYLDGRHFSDAGLDVVATALSATIAQVSAPPWSPTQLFSTVDNGFIFDVSDMTTLWQDSAKTTPVAADGDPVGFVQDISGRGNHLSQATASRRPIYRAGGGKPYLQFDNLDDFLDFPSGALHFPNISVHIGAAQYDTASVVISVPHAATHVSPYFRWSIWTLSSTKNESRFNGTPRQSGALSWWQNPVHFGFDTVAGTFYENSAVNSTFPAVTLGGKRNLAKTLINRIAQIEHTTYVEPFVGMGDRQELLQTTGREPCPVGHGVAHK